MCKIVAFVQLPACSLERRIIEKGPQKFVVTQFQARAFPKVLRQLHADDSMDQCVVSQFPPRPHLTVQRSRVLECTHNRSSHRNDATAPFFRALNCARGYFRNPIWFVQRKQTIEFLVTCGRNTRGVCDRFEFYSSLPHLRESVPIESEACRWRFERNRRSGDPRPNIPECERCRNVRVLDWSAMMGQSRPNMISSTFKSK